VTLSVADLIRGIRDLLDLCFVGHPWNPKQEG